MASHGDSNGIDCDDSREYSSDGENVFEHDPSNDDAISKLRRIQTQPAGLSKFASPLETAIHQPVRKSKTGRFQQFRRASAVLIEEVTHSNKENRQSENRTTNKGTFRRRVSFSDLFHRKSHRLVIGVGETAVVEKQTPSVDNLEQQIAVLFADVPPSPTMVDNMDSIYHWAGTADNAFFMSSFGKQGTAKGDFQDVKNITLLQGDRMLITDFILGRINLCNGSGKLLLLYTGSELSEPWATVALDDNMIAMTSRKHHCVKILSVDGEVALTFGEEIFQYPAGIALNRDGLYVVCDAQANKVSLHNSDGLFLRYLGNTDRPEERLNTPRYVCVSDKGDIIVSDSGNHTIKVFSSNGNFVRSFGSFGSASGQLKFPYGVCTDKHGTIFVADHYNNRISVFSAEGAFLRHLVTADQGLRHPQALAISSDKILYVSHGKIKANELLTFDLNSLNTKS